MINKDSIVTAYDEHLTLVEWLQKVETALDSAVLTNLGIAKLSDKDNVATYQVTATFADNTTIASDSFTLPSTDIVTAFNNLKTLVNGFDFRISTNRKNINSILDIIDIAGDKINADALKNSINGDDDIIVEIDNDENNEKLGIHLSPELQSKIVKNTADIEKNTADITKNATDIGSLTSKIATNTADITNLETRTKNLEDSKIDVNTGTFDPTSNNPPSQVNLAGLLTAGYLLNGVRIAYNNNSFRYAFFSLPSLVSGKIKSFDNYYKRHYVIGFNGQNLTDADYSYLFAGGEFAEFDYSKNIDAILRKTEDSLKNGRGMFCYCINLITIGEYDFSDFNNLYEAFLHADNLKHIHIKHFKVSFNISMSTAFEESDLVEIIGNLDSVTSYQSLTMGSANLAKLTEAEKKVATDKGWTLA